MTRMTWGQAILAIAGAITLGGLAGCSSQEPEAPTNNSQQEAPAPQAASPEPAVTPPAENASEPEPAAPAAKPLPAAKPITAEEQMMDDASATGMTSHVSRGQDATSGDAN